MFKTSSATFAVVFVSIASAPVQAQHKPEVIERGKRATALVEVATAEGAATGSAFCIDKSGLFITNSHVVRDASQNKGAVHLVIDIGLKTQRSIVAKVLRADDGLDLALLKTDANSGLTALELGKDDSLLETAPVITFGFPFGRSTTVRAETYPDITVLPSHITALRRDKGRLEGVQFDGQLNPGNSGGPVLDDSGRVIGVAVATVRGAAINLAIPVGRLADFLTAPGLVFEPPPLTYKDRSLPVTWTIKVMPSKPDAKLPEKLSVSVTLADGISEPRTIPAQSIGNGEFRVKVTPVAGDPDQKVELDVRFPNNQMVQVQVKDGVVKVGNTRFLLSDLQVLFGGATPRVHSRRGAIAQGPIAGLGKVKTKVGKKTVTIDLNEASQITVRPLKPQAPVQAVEALVEAKQGAKVLATVLKRAELGGAPVPRAVAVRVGRNIVIVPADTRPPAVRVPQNAEDDRLLELGGVLNVDGAPRRAGKAIRPPPVDINNPRDSGLPLTRKLEAPIRDVATGGGGRYLLLTLREVHKLAVFDVNVTDVVKTIELPSDNALAAAGAKTLIIASPDKAFFERWDIDTMTRQGERFSSPIKGRLIALAMGSDSDGPLLAVWSPDSRNGIPQQPRFSFVDAKTFKVLKAGRITNGGFQGIGSVSAAGGSIHLHPSIRDLVHVRASAGGDLYAIWHTESTPSGFQTLAVRKNLLNGIYNHDALDHLAPGPDGRTVFTGRGGVLDAQGKPLRGSAQKPPASSELTIPSADPAYYLSMSGLDQNGSPNSPRKDVTASVRSADDGTRLLRVQNLDEMEGARPNESWIKDDFTVDKRFQLIPAANLLITIPFTNDRLVVRRLDIRKAVDTQGGARK